MQGTAYRNEILSLSAAEAAGRQLKNDQSLARYLSRF